MPELRAALDLPFQEQIEFFRAKLNLPTERWDDILHSAHDRAFVVAGAMKADLLDDLRRAVSPLQRTTLEAFRKDFKAIVAKNGWTGWTGEGTQAGEAWRTKVIFETNVRSAHAAGRYRQLTDPDTLKAMPYWRYVHNDSVMHPRPQHLAWNGTTLPHDHPFWATHFAPNGWGCRCKIVAQRQPGAGDQARPPEGWDQIDPKTGAPKGIDKGWGYAPGAGAQSTFTDLIGQKLIKLDSGIGAALSAALKPALLEERARAFAGFVDASLADVARGKSFVAGALKPHWVDRAEKAGIRPETAEIAVRDKDVRHTFRDAKHAPLDLAWYKDLPRHLDEPGAVLLDTTRTDAPAFLLLYDTPGKAAKLVVRVNYQTRKAGALNIVETGQYVDPSGIAGMIGHGYEWVDGSL